MTTLTCTHCLRTFPNAMQRADHVWQTHNIEPDIANPTHDIDTTTDYLIAEARLDGARQMRDRIAINCDSTCDPSECEAEALLEQLKVFLTDKEQDNV